MSTPISCIRLPLLRGDMPPETPLSSPSSLSRGVEALRGAALRLWPGLPQPPDAGWFCPDEYPFAPREAQACLEDFRGLGDAALSGLPVGAASAGNAAAARRASEMASLHGFEEAGGDEALARAQAAEAARRLRLEREQAQKALLWVWLQEERLAELAELTRRYAAGADVLAEALGPDREAVPDMPDLAGLGGISLDSGLMPPWKLVAANAVYFLPPDMPVLMEEPMRGDLPDALALAPAPGRAEALAGAAAAGVEVLEATAPAWLVLGRTRPTGSPALDALRVWMTWRQGA